MTERTILITGATGNVGSEMVAVAQNCGLSATAAIRNLDQSHRLPDGFPAVEFDFHEPATWEPALRGQNALFLVRPPAIANVKKNINPFIDLAYQVGIEHIVFVSVIGADRNRFIPHAKIESHLVLREKNYTILRPGFFAQNLQDAYRRDIVEDDRIYLPAGRSKVNWIDVRDIADVAALVFQQPHQHRGKSYSLCGPGPVGWDHVTTLLSAVTNRTIKYKPASIPGYMIHLWRRGLPTGAIVVQTFLHTMLRFGNGATIDSTLENLLGHPGRSIETYIRDHAEMWAR